MTRNEWLEMIQENEEKILEGLRELYKKATGSSVGQFRCTHSLILDDDGEPRLTYDTGNSTDGAVWNGNAIYVARIEDFIPWENDYTWENWIEPSLKEDEINSFRSYIQEEFETENEQYLNFENLEKWNKEVYERVTDECIDADIAEYMEDWVDQKYNMLIDEIKMEISMEE